MNRSAIQKFAVWARTALMEQVAQRAYQYGVTAEGYGEERAVTVNGQVLTTQEQQQRRELVLEVQAKGYAQVVEEVAYTWFNRFIALRYMEVNNFLPGHIRVFSNAAGAFDPEIMKEALHLDLPGLDQSKVAGYIEHNEHEALYRYLLLTQCNALNEALPKMFEEMGGYNKGGEARKWYGNNDYVVNWENDGCALKAYTKGASGGRMVSLEYFFLECMTWSMVSTKAVTFRFKPFGSILSNAGPACFSNAHLLYFIGLLNSSVATTLLQFISPTINCTSGNIAIFPTRIRQESIVTNQVSASVQLSKTA